MTTPLFTEDLTNVGRSRLEQFLIQVSGDDKGTIRIAMDAELETVVGPETPGMLQPSNSPEAKDNAKYHPLLVWEGSQYCIVPGPGCFGRVVTIYYGWRTPGQDAPKSKDDFKKLSGYTYTVLGGNANPVFTGEWMTPPFNAIRHKVVKSSFLALTNPLELFWYFEEADVATKTGTGARAFIRWEGELRRYGNYY